MFGECLFSLGLALLAHCGHAVTQRINLINLVYSIQKQSSLPIEIVCETIIALVISTIAISLVSGNLLPITLEGDALRCKMESIDNIDSYRIMHDKTRYFN